MFKIKKVLNSSVVLAENEELEEYILLGKGIGYAQKKGNIIEKYQADQIFIPVQNVKVQEFLGLLNTIPPIFIELTQQIVNYSEQKLDTELSTGIYFTLMDHINFAVERYNKGINITNKVYWELENYYPEELDIGKHALQLINQELEINLPNEEAANIAFHIINAHSGKEESKDSMKTAKLIGSIMSLVKYALNINLDKENIHYLRFVTHIKFFIERYFADQMLENENDILFEQIANLYPEAMDGAFRIKEYITQVHGKNIPNDELTYLAVHIHRLLSYEQLI